jgi:hypothetical protein
MMGRHEGDQRQLFYLFNLEDRIPTDHLFVGKNLQDHISASIAYMAIAEQRHFHCDIVRGEFGRIADARQHQRCGELMTPPHRTTSRSAWAVTVLPSWIYSIPTARWPSKTSLVASALTSHVVSAIAAPGADKHPPHCSGDRPSPSSARRRSLPAARRCNPVCSCIRRLAQRRRKPRPADRKIASSASPAGHRCRDKSWRRPSTIPGGGNREVRRHRTSR